MDLPRELRDVLLNALRVLPLTFDPGQREALEEGLRTGTLSDALLEPLARLVTESLHSGHVRRLHGPHTEAAVRQLYRRLPPARQLQEQLRRLSGALAGLQGQALQQMNVSLVSPCTYLVTLETDQCRLQIEFGPEGAELRSLELGV